MARNADDPNIARIDLAKQYEMPKEEFEKACMQTQEWFESVSEEKNMPSKRRKNTIWSCVRPQPSAEPKLSYELDNETANKYADNCRSEGAILERESELDAAGVYYDRACTIRARNGLFCTPDNARAHVEFAQNLARRGEIPSAEYHLRTALDIYRLLGMCNHVMYGDVLLYQAVVVDKQGRGFKAESFYRAAVAVYKKNRVSGGNFRVAVDLLVQNLRRQGHEDKANNGVSEFMTMVRKPT